MGIKRYHIIAGQKEVGDARRFLEYKAFSLTLGKLEIYDLLESPGHMTRVTLSETNNVGEYNIFIQTNCEPTEDNPRGFSKELRDLLNAE